jgi:hypothetical protein
MCITLFVLEPLQVLASIDDTLRSHPLNFRALQSIKHFNSHLSSKALMRGGLKFRANHLFGALALKFWERDSHRPLISSNFYRKILTKLWKFMHLILTGCPSSYVKCMCHVLYTQNDFLSLSRERWILTFCKHLEIYFDMWS